MQTNNHAADRALAKDARLRIFDENPLDKDEIIPLADAIDRLCDEVEQPITITCKICGDVVAWKEDRARQRNDDHTADRELADDARRHDTDFKCDHKLAPLADAIDALLARIAELRIGIAQCPQTGAAKHLNDLLADDDEAQS